MGKKYALVIDQEADIQREISLPDGRARIKQIICQETYVLVLTEQGGMFRLGDFPIGGKKDLRRYNFLDRVPQPIGDLNRISMEQISCNQTGVIAIGRDRQFYSWGVDEGQFGFLGQGITRFISTPIRISGFREGGKFISLGEKHAAAVDLSGNLYTWGTGADGELGFSKKRSDIPTRISGIDPFVVKAAKCDKGVTFVLTANGHLYFFGKISKTVGSGKELRSINCLKDVFVQRFEVSRNHLIVSGFQGELQVIDLREPDNVWQVDSRGQRIGSFGACKGRLYAIASDFICTTLIEVDLDTASTTAHHRLPKSIAHAAIEPDNSSAAILTYDRGEGGPLKLENRRSSKRHSAHHELGSGSLTQPEHLKGAKTDHFDHRVHELRSLLSNFGSGHEKGATTHRRKRNEGLWCFGRRLGEINDGMRESQDQFSAILPSSNRGTCVMLGTERGGNDSSTNFRLNTRREANQRMRPPKTMLSPSSGMLSEDILNGANTPQQRLSEGSQLEIKQLRIAFELFSAFIGLKRISSLTAAWRCLRRAERKVKPVKLKTIETRLLLSILRKLYQRREADQRRVAFQLIKRIAEQRRQLFHLKCMAAAKILSVAKGLERKDMLSRALQMMQKIAAKRKAESAAKRKRRPMVNKVGVKYLSVRLELLISKTLGVAFRAMRGADRRERPTPIETPAEAWIAEAPDELELSPEATAPKDCGSPTLAFDSQNHSITSDLRQNIAQRLLDENRPGAVYRLMKSTERNTSQIFENHLRHSAPRAPTGSVLREIDNLPKSATKVSRFKSMSPRPFPGKDSCSRKSVGNKNDEYQKRFQPVKPLAQSNSYMKQYAARQLYKNSPSAGRPKHSSVSPDRLLKEIDL
eukprot:TRINITY_DN9099_c0_g1_i3.p1 TRINITY_DN9099_c0_g1~~TRINITY_DN9099_c0_g1_i3.p1  ORF type:complete len:867 (-),score=125.66 TRINITY_DN9099_c0_g1_i3:23-2623(-)